MKTILLALDAINPDINAINFACFSAEMTKATITGVFLENTSGKKKSEKNKEKQLLIEKNILQFHQVCNDKRVPGRVHRATGNPVKAILAESRFADLIITGPDTSFNRSYDSTPSEFVKKILEKAECPVIISPMSFETVREIIFTYDGSASSAFAIKQFTYFFPQLSDKKTTIIQVNTKGKWSASDKAKLTEWLNVHYTDLHFDVQKGNNDLVLFEWLFKRKNTFIVMGAYGRSSLSKFFKKSFADVIIHILSQPIFVAHT